MFKQTHRHVCSPPDLKELHMFSFYIMIFHQPFCLNRSLPNTILRSGLLGRFLGSNTSKPVAGVWCCPRLHFRNPFVTTESGEATDELVGSVEREISSELVPDRSLANVVEIGGVGLVGLVVGWIFDHIFFRFLMGVR